MSDLKCSNAPPRFLRPPDVDRMTGLGKSTRYELESRGLFPSRLKLTGGRSSAYVESEVIAWMQARITSGRVATRCAS